MLTIIASMVPWLQMSSAQACDECCACYDLQNRVAIRAVRSEESHTWTNPPSPVGDSPCKHTRGCSRGDESLRLNQSTYLPQLKL